jgi:enoyl-CoA hydratase/carnithine racemase
MSNYLSFTREGRVARITLNRPEKRNALNMEMCRELATALEDAAADENTGAILLAGSGSAFCAGMDLDEVLGTDPGALHQVHEELFTFASRLAKPVVAAVHGAALGGGTGLVANCHVVVAADDARFGLTEIRIGLWPFVVFRAVTAAAGERRALEWSVTGRIFGSPEALHAGLVHRVAPAAEVSARAGEIAADIAAYSPAAMARGLAFVNETRGMSREEVGEIARAARAELMRGLDFEEGVRAFREKRPPEWPSLVR